MNSNRWYWYKHIDPDTDEVVYVGHGSGGRAWQCGSSHSPLRSKEHCKWADDLLDRGITPDEWVFIEDRGISKQEAREIENKMIHDLKPLFNKSIRSPLLKFTPEIYRQALGLRAGGLSYEAIAKRVGLSTMVVHRGLNKQPISLECALEQE